MKPKNPRTKIIRIRGGEVYFERMEFDDGVRWMPYLKDTSATIASYRDTKFKCQDYLSRTPTPVEPAIIPIPENFATDLLGPYARLEYARGHEPIKPLRLR